MGASGQPRNYPEIAFLTSLPIARAFSRPADLHPDASRCIQGREILRNEGMNTRNPIRPHHRERLLDLSSNTHVARPGRLDLFNDIDRPRALRRRLAEAARYGADDPESWVNRHLQRRIERLRERGDTAPDILLPVEPY